MKSGIVGVNGTSLYHEVAGVGEPVVFIHGFSLDGRMWDDQFEAFVDRYQVIRYDLRGFGRSALPDGVTYSHADDLSALLQYLEVDAVNIIGLSLGGLVALNFSLAYPEMINRLILADSALAGYHWSSDWIASMDAIDDRARLLGAGAANQLWLEHPLFSPAREDIRVAGRLAQIANDYSGWHWVNDDPQKESNPPVIERLGEVVAPALIVLRERDLPDFHAIAAILEQRIPNSQAFKVERAGHMVNMEASREFNRAVLDFLGTTRPESALQ